MTQITAEKISEYLRHLREIKVFGQQQIVIIF